MLRGSLRAFAPVALLVWTGCAALIPAPIVENQTFRIPKGALEKIAIIPFAAKPLPLGRTQAGGIPPAEAAKLIARFMADALAKRGMSVIPPSDMEIAFANQRVPIPRRDPRAAAELAVEQFGATAVMLGQVSRYRERAGERYGSTKGASVAFEVTIFSATAIHRVWATKFDQTQRPITENALNAPRYPGGGTRWLTAAELAQWGVAAAVETLPANR